MAEESERFVAEECERPVAEECERPVAEECVLRGVRHTRRRIPKARGRRMRKARGREKIRVALEQQIWNEIESSHFAFTLHTQPGCYITVPSCSARVTLKEHTPRAISMFDF